MMSHREKEYHEHNGAERMPHEEKEYNEDTTTKKRRKMTKPFHKKRQLITVS